MTETSATQRSSIQAIRPFQVASVPEIELLDLRRHIKATKWNVDPWLESQTGKMSVVASDK